MGPQQLEVRIEVAQNLPQISNYADIALKTKLYVSGWTLSDDLKSIRKKPELCLAIGLAFIGNDAVGVATILKAGVDFSTNYGQVFTKKDFRRHKIGTKLIEAVCAQGIIPKFNAHDQRSYRFFQSQKTEIKINKWACVQD